MADPSCHQSAIMYQNMDRTLVLVDIPTSIARAQGTLESPCFDTPYSSPAIEEPHASVEPKGRRASSEFCHFFPPLFSKEEIHQKLSAIRKEHQSPFCLQRAHTALSRPRLGKRKRAEDAPILSNSPFVEPNFEKGRADNLTEPTIDLEGLSAWQEPFVLSSASRSDDTSFDSIPAVANRIISNSSLGKQRFRCSWMSQMYRMPPSSSFILSDINATSAVHFSDTIQKIYPEPSSSAAPGQFDFVLLDPPWHNRSVRRSQKYKMNSRDHQGPMKVLQSMLAKHIAPGALIGCWVTNSPTVRVAALDTFSQWDVELTEEWLWLKTTIQGDPVGNIDSLWRRPYETVLIGRMRDPLAASPSPIPSRDHTQETHKRLIVAVPDFHSRKPSLKELIEPMMSNPSKYRALEVFARNLTAGWLSWGDEVLKYNWEGYWREE